MRVRGAGPTPNEFFICGSGPGWEEDKAGVAFVGKTGRELARFFNGDELPALETVFRTNLYRQYGGKQYRYTAEDRRRDEPELLAEIRRVRPKILIPLGGEATHWMLGDVDLDAVQGIPWRLPETAAWYPCPPEGTVVFPVVHPASAFHNADMAGYVVSGFGQLAAYLDGQIEPRTLFDDAYPEPQYEEITTSAQLAAILDGYERHIARHGPTPIAVDTEGWPGNPWSVQIAFEPGTGYLIRSTAGSLLRQLSDALHRIRPPLTYHAALHDLRMMTVLGLPTDLVFDDTAVMAYLLQIEPRGLKPLCVRHCNMQMQSYTDVLGESGERVALDYLTWLWERECTLHEAACEREFVRLVTTPYYDAKGRLKPGRRLSKPPALPKSPLLKAVTRVLQSKRPRELWQDQVEDIRVAARAVLGSMPEATLDFVPRTVAVQYGCRDSDGTTRLLPELSRRIDSLGLRDVYDLELATYPLIHRMAQVGIRPDLIHFAALSAKLDTEITTVRARLGERTGAAQFNANSGIQVADYLFGELGLDELKMTARGDRGSTNDKILEALEHEHPDLPVISDIRHYRETYKLKHTFVDRLPEFVHRWPFDGRVHTTFRTTTVVTGRLAASDPNLLAQPEHGAFAADFRRGWVAEPGHVLAMWDESQVELRGLAHLSQDPTMLAVFRGEKRNPDGSMVDLHAALAERIFGVKPKDQDKHKHRLPAKAINFGLPMGMTYKGLTVELRKNGVFVSEDDAQRWIDETMGLYTGIPAFQRRMVAEAQRHGYIRCLSGRIRYIGGIHSTNERVRAEAERFAFSTPVQESAQYIMKQAERTVWEDILVPWWRQGRWVEPLLQQHDSLKFEVAEGLQDELHEQVSEAMTSVSYGLSVPLVVEGEWGVTMGDMEKF